MYIMDRMPLDYPLQTVIYRPTSQVGAGKFNVEKCRP